MDLPETYGRAYLHVYRKSDLVLFRAKKYLLNDIIDWFGSDITFFDETDEEITAKGDSKPYGNAEVGIAICTHTRILSPQSLAEEVKKDIEAAHKNYKRKEIKFENTGD